MSTKAIKTKRNDSSLRPDWESVKERAPSVMRADEPLIARWVAVFGLVCTVVGASALVAGAIGRPYLVSPGVGFYLAMVGVAGLVFHAFNEKDLQYRRLYGAAGALLLAAAVVVRLLPVAEEIGRLFLPVGVPFLLMVLLFLVSFARNETDPVFKKATVRLLGVAAVVMIGVALIGSNVGTEFERFLVTEGTLLLILALLYVAAFIALQEPGSDVGYRAGFGLGVVGAVLFLNGLVRPWFSDRFVYVPSGFLLIYLGIEYLLLSVGVCSDSTLVVLTLRELAAIFYSPIAYIVLVGLAVIGWFQFFLFVARIAVMSENPMGQPMLEPILAHYILHFFPIMSVVLAVPVLTMRLFSEEQRTGTLEVLLTAPVKESSVVLSKYLAALRFYLLIWYPWGLYLLALRVEGGQEFDVRPLLSFGIALAVTGAGFLAMGVFFSSLTKSQIAAAVLTFMGMMVLTGIYWLKADLPQESMWGTVLNYVSYVDVWITAVTGSLAPRFLLFHLSAAVFWLFLTTKILEARKWA